MKTPRLIERLKHNLTIKILCFVIAFFIYLFYNISTLDKKVFSVPLEIQQEGEVLVTNTPTHFVRVSVKGKPEDIVQISEQDFSAIVDLNSYVKEGTFSVPVLLYLSKQASLYSPLEYSCKPERITLDIDKKCTNLVPVEASFTGTVAPGYEISSIQIEPAYLQAQGPEKFISLLEKFKTKEVSLENASVNFVKTVDIINTNSFIKIDPNTKASVYVTINQIFENKKFQTNEGTFTGLLENLMVEEPFPSVSLLIRGFVNSLENFSLDTNSLQINLSSIEKEGTYEFPILTNLPSDFEVLEIEPETITLTIKEKLIDLEIEE